MHGARCTGARFEFRVVAAFLPNQSWVRPSMLRGPAESARALRHEQTHFDLTEVHARQLRRYYTELMAPCRIPSNDLAAAASRIGRDEKAAQAQYDAETDNGRIPAQQARWDREIAAQLTTLAKYVK
jgi:predicted secreted Zn-dependent protease